MSTSSSDSTTQVHAYIEMTSIFALPPHITPRNIFFNQYPTNTSALQTAGILTPSVNVAMEISRIVLLFLFKVAIGALPLAYAQLYFLPESTPSYIREFRWPISYGIALVVYLIDQLVIYPRFRDPYRHLPSAKEHTPGEIIFESPRGKTPLKWMRKYPDADLLRVDGAVGGPTLIPASADALRDLLNTNSYDFEKSWGVRAFLSRALGFGLILSEGAEHKRQRKALTPAFNIRKIRELYGLMWEKTNVLLTELGKQAPGTVDVTDWASRLTLDIIGPTAIGKDFNSLQTEGHPVAKAFEELLEPRLDALILLGAHWVIPEYILRRVPVKVNWDIDRITTFLRKECRQFVVDKHKELLDGKKIADTDILGAIMQTGDFTDDLLVDEMLTFLAAGHETTANALTWVCYLCAHNPHVQEKLRAEIRATIPSASSPITYDILENMPYLNGVCEETLRLYPTVPVTIRESIKDTHVAGVPIFRGTEFILIPFAINRHPRFWGEDADKIVPERWIDTDKDGRQRPNKNGGTSTNFSEITFLHGPRACIGRDFAKAELRCAVAGVLGRFEIKPDTMKEPTITGVITMRAVGGIHLKFKELDGW
ncbi:hypothetical protein AMS68_007198 [Peltaster fructicola]|uniref:Cytochrome P450 monooxygenase n=1 Tax=Peltaster fructicola TaxID=286661 RepID=A0A6H0Y434_9PEZI|nr:hypothetical protein AMS68_007198 [Peltaster fructicola]